MLIGLAGKKRSGKDTVARMLKEHGFVQSSFAAPIRSFVASLLGATLDELEIEKEDPIALLDGVTPRHMMQTLGTEWGRELIHPELWLRSWRMRYQRYLYIGVDVVVSDVRFDNEARIIEQLGGVVVQIVRPGLPDADSHISETPLPENLIHGYLYNDSDMETLQQRVTDMLTTLQHRGARSHG